MERRHPVRAENPVFPGKMFITGADGLLGRDIHRCFSETHRIERADRDECDVTRPEECRRAVARFRPDVVIHCAAYTAVDRAEREERQAFDLNAGGTRNMAVACREQGALLVTFGSDYVFDGTSDRPYVEEDRPRPLSAYGRSKLAAEEALREVAPEFLLVRTQWLFGPHGRNFARSVLDRARRGEDLRVVNDQRGSPTYTRDLAEAVGNLIGAGARGVYHFSNEGETTFFDYAAFLLEHGVPRKVCLEPVPTRELSKDMFPAPRPHYAVLNKGKYSVTTGKTPRHWKVAVLDFLRAAPASGMAW